MEKALPKKLLPIATTMTTTTLGCYLTTQFSMVTFYRQCDAILDLNLVLSMR